VHEANEVLDLVDESDNVIGTIQRRHTHGPAMASMNGFIRTAEAFMMNDEGKLWVPIRSMTKSLAPGGFDFACAEHVGTGETPLQAMMRGFGEELNLKIDPSALKLLGVISPDVMPVFRTTYLFRSNDEPNYNLKDFSSAEWMTLAELRHRIKEGAHVKNTLIAGLDLLEEKLAIREK
jgi:isopentenyldiphosphate isomerase